MKDAFLPLLLTALFFFFLTVWRVRPLVLLKSWRTERRGAMGALREIQGRIERAADGSVRATALCEAADIVAKRAGGRESAAGLYLRAMRSDPASAHVVDRAVAGLARRPRTLELLLWRYLASVRWNDSVVATATALDALRTLYEGPLRNALRARALANARDAFTVERSVSPP